MTIIDLNGAPDQWLPPAPNAAQDDPDDLSARLLEFLKKTRASGNTTESARSSSQPTTPETQEPELDEVEKLEGPYILKKNSSIKLNYVAIAEKFTEDHQIAWSSHEKAFFQYCQGLWVPVDDATMHGHLASFLRALAEQKNAPELKFKRNTATFGNILQQAKPKYPLGAPPTQEEKLLPMQNGVLCLAGDSPVLNGFNPEFWFTASCSVAWNENATCPRFTEELLKPALQHEEDLVLLQRLLGSLLIAGERSRFILLLVGVGGSGKSTLVSVLEELLGRHRFANLRSFKSRMETHFYQGKDILTAKDEGPLFLKQCGSDLKRLTGSDLDETEQKYGGKFHLKNNFDIIVTANQAPLLKVQNDEEAWLRRIFSIHFKTPPAKPIPGFEKILIEQEGEGILKWLVDGFYSAQEEISEHGHFHLSEAQQLRRSNYVNESQSIRVFVRDQIIIGQGNITSGEAYSYYINYSRTRNWTPEPAQTFYTEFRRLANSIHGVDQCHDLVRGLNTNHRGYRGLIFRPAEVAD